MNRFTVPPEIELVLDISCADCGYPLAIDLTRSDLKSGKILLWPCSKCLTDAKEEVNATIKWEKDQIYE